MIRILTLSLCLFWALFFAFQAAMLAIPAIGGSTQVDAGIIGLASVVAGSVARAIIFASAFAFAATMFIWSALGAVVSAAGTTDVNRDMAGRAFAFAAGTVTLAFAVALSDPSPSLFQSMSLYIAGLAGSYGAIAAERIAAAQGGSRGRDLELARVVAQHAANGAVLDRAVNRRGDR